PFSRPLELTATRGGNSLFRDYIPYFGHTTLADKRQVFAIPIKGQAPCHAVNPERREKIRARVGHVPEVEAGARGPRPGHEGAVGAETDIPGIQLRQPGNLVQQQPELRSSVGGTGANLPEDYPAVARSGEETAIATKGAGPDPRTQRVGGRRQFLP